MTVDIDKVVARGKNIAARYRGRKYMSWAKSEAMVRDLLAALEQSQKHDRDYAKCECGCIVNVQHNNRPICAKCGKTAELICIEIELVKALQRAKKLEGANKALRESNAGQNITDLLAALEQSQEQVDELEGAAQGMEAHFRRHEGLKQWLQHDAFCPKAHTSTAPACTCGLDEALSRKDGK